MCARSARRTSIVYSSYTISSHRPRQRRRRRHARARRVIGVQVVHHVSAVASRARSSRASSKSPNARSRRRVVAVVSTARRVDGTSSPVSSRSRSRARVLIAAFSSSISARVQRSLWFPREGHRCHRSRAARFVDASSSGRARTTRRVVAEVRQNRAFDFRNNARVARGEPENGNESTSAHEK